MHFVTRFGDKSIPIVIICTILLITRMGAFTPDEVRPFLEEARALGLGLKLHVDQLRPGQGAELAASLHAVSADHLESVERRRDRRARRGPGHRACSSRPPRSSSACRATRRGAPWSTAVSAWPSPPTATPAAPPPRTSRSALSLACLQNGLTPTEALLGVTRRGGEALGDTSLGRLRVGGPADLVVLGAPDVDHLVAHVGTSHVQAVVRAGRLVLRADNTARC